jgi:hypothetical protein
VKIGRTIEKLFKGVFFHGNFPAAPIILNFEELFELFVFDSSQAGSIGVLFVEIGSLVE